MADTRHRKTTVAKVALVLSWASLILGVCMLWALFTSGLIDAPMRTISLARSRRPSPPKEEVATPEMLDKLAKPVVIAIKSSHFFGGGWPGNISDCHYRGNPIQCQWVDGSGRGRPDADAVWYHMPSVGSSAPTRDAPHQLAVAMSMESSQYYGSLDDIRVMDQYDIENTYRTCSHVPVPYFYGGGYPIHSSYPNFREPVPWEEKKTAIAYVNSNCGALNGRNEIVKRLMDMNRIPVHAHGSCLQNQQHEGSFDKVDVFRGYKFCIAMENSNAQDYVTEKLWDALVAGCLPIYWGAPNILDFVPAPNAFLDYGKFSSLDELMFHLETLAEDKEAYQQHMAWKWTPLNELSRSYQQATALWGDPLHGFNRECQLCQVIMHTRLYGLNLSRTHCLRNEAWKAAAANGSSIWANRQPPVLMPSGVLRTEQEHTAQARKMLTIA